MEDSWNNNLFYTNKLYLSQTIHVGLKLLGKMQIKAEIEEKGCENHGGICAICLDKIVLQETALVKGCEHAYWFV